MTRYIVVLSPWRDWLMQIEPRLIELTVDGFWKGKAFALPVDDKQEIPVTVLQNLVRTPDTTSAHIEHFRYHTDPNYSTFCNEEFLFCKEAEDANSYLILTTDHRIAGTILILGGTTSTGDNLPLTERQLANLLNKYFRNDPGDKTEYSDKTYKAMWPSSSEWRCWRVMTNDVIVEEEVDS